MVARIVSLVPSSSETVCSLGASDRLVGVTRYCSHPAAPLAHLPRVGGTKNPSRERVVALRPDLVIGNAEENRAEDLAWFAERVPVLVQTPRTVAEARAAIVELAIALGRAAAADPLVAAIDAAMAAAAHRAAQTTGPSRRVFYAIWRKPWMGVGADTYVHDVLRLAGAVNVCCDAPARYPRVDPAELVARGLDVVLLASEPWPFSADERDEIAVARVFGDATVLRCDGRDFCWHGAHSGPGLRGALALFERLAADARSRTVTP